MPGHTAFTCPFKPRKPLKRSRMKRVGPVTRKLIHQRAQFFADTPPPYYCYYCLFCGHEEELTMEQAQVEHFYTKNNRPDLRFDRSNLVISCAYHNKDKGGMDGPEYLKKLEEIKGI
jgi:hypothetical protein